MSEGENSRNSADWAADPFRPHCNVVVGLITRAADIREYVAANGGQPLPCGVGQCVVKLTWLSKIHKIGIQRIHSDRPRGCRDGHSRFASTTSAVVIAMITPGVSDIMRAGWLTLGERATSALQHRIVVRAVAGHRRRPVQRGLFALYIFRIRCSRAVVAVPLFGADGSPGS
jgi:hypothetical protein